MKKVRSLSAKEFNRVKTEMEALEAFAYIQGDDFTEFHELFSKIPNEKKADLIILLNKTGYKSNETIISYMKKYLMNDEFKKLIIQKLITSKFDRDIATFRGDLFNRVYFSIVNLKQIIKELKLKNPLSALCMLIYCRNQLKKLDADYYTKNCEELFATTKAIVYDFQWIENIYPDLEFSTLTEQQLDSVGLLLGEEIYLDIYFDNVDHLSTDPKEYLKPPSVTLKSFPFSPITWAIYNGSVKCFKTMIANLKPNEFKSVKKSINKYAYSLAICSGNLEGRGNFG